MRESVNKNAILQYKSYTRIFKVNRGCKKACKRRGQGA